MLSSLSAAAAGAGAAASGSAAAMPWATIGHVIAVMAAAGLGALFG